MAQWFNTPFYKSSAWKKCRKSFIEYRHSVCERCGNPGWHVHHKIFLSELNINDPNITLSFENLELLCDSCHSKEHHPRRRSTRHDVMFDENGDVVSR